MARLVGVDLPREKRVEVALTYIFGIGRTRALQTLAETGVNPDTRVRDLTDDDLVKLRDWIKATTASRVTFDARWPETSAARSRSAATRASVTAVACRSAVSAPTPTLVAVRVRARRWPARRR